MLKAYITNLSEYVAGRLVGAWIELPISDEDFADVLHQIGIGPNAEEYFFTDFESDGPVTDYLGEYDSIERLNAIADSLDLIKAEGDIDKLYAYLQANGCDIMDAIENIDDCTFYDGETLEDVAEYIVTQCYDLPDFALLYFDFEAFARGLSFNGYTETTYGVIAR